MPVLYSGLLKIRVNPGSKVGVFVLKIGVFGGTDCTPRVVAKETGRRLGGSVVLGVLVINE